VHQRTPLTTTSRTAGPGRRQSTPTRPGRRPVYLRPLIRPRQRHQLPQTGR